MFDELSMHACTKQNNKCLRGRWLDEANVERPHVRTCGPDDEPAMHSADDRNMHVTERAMGGVADVASARVSVSLHYFGLINGCITHC
jgi:hypothetical protein